MLRIPTEILDLQDWAKELTDNCMGSSVDRGLIYTRAAQYYYTGTYDARAAIYNKIKGFVDKLAGFLMQPTDVRFQITFDSGEDDSVLSRAQLAAEKLTADFSATNSDVTFAAAVVMSLVNGCQLLKIAPNRRTKTFRMAPVHPQNFGVLNEAILELDEQEAFCHVSYPTISRLDAELEAQGHPKRKEILERLLAAKIGTGAEEEPTYLHQMIVGGMQPLGSHGEVPSASGIVQVFPSPAPWRPQKFWNRMSETVKHCELWVKDAGRPNDYTVIQMVYPDIIIEGDKTRRNISGVPGHNSFVKIQPQETPGYFWGRSIIADVQMLQDVLNQRLRDLNIMWQRNARAPQLLSGFSSVTEEMYFKLINEGGFLADPNPNAKAQKIMDPPPDSAMQEIQFIFQMFDEAGGFSPIMSGQGEPGVRAGVHAQTLVRTSSPRLIDQAARIERQLAECGYIGLRIMQDEDAMIYTTDSGIDFTLADLPSHYQVIVDSHSASPAFAEDNRQLAIALARAGAVDAEDLIHMLHPPGAQLLLARLRQRKKAEAEQAKADEKRETLLSLVTGKGKKPAGAGRRSK
jgi:hypothetical protein